MKKKLLFIFVLFILFIADVYSQIKINKMPCDAFVELVFDGTKKYVEKNDGFKIYGDELEFKYMGRKRVIIGGVSTPLDEVKGFFSKGKYFIRDGKFFYKLLVSGKISVYEYSQNVSSSSRDINYRDCIYYTQKEGSDKFILLNNRESMVKILAGCKKAINLINFDYKELNEKVKKNKAYLNEAFQIYNNGCSEVGLGQEKN